MLQNKLKKLSKNRGPIEHSSFVEKTSISTFFKAKIALNDVNMPKTVQNTVVLTGVEPDTGVVEDGWSGSDEDPATDGVHPHYLYSKQQHGLDRMTESDDSDYVYDPNVQGKSKSFPSFPLLPIINPILDKENQNLIDQINRNQQNIQNNQNDQNDQIEQPDFNERRSLQPQNNIRRGKFTYEPATQDQQLRAQALGTLEWNKYLQEQEKNDEVRAREYRKRKAAEQRKHRGTNTHNSGVIHPKAAGDVNRNRPYTSGVIHPKAAGDVNKHGAERRNNNWNKSKKPYQRRSGTLKNQLKNLEVKYKKRDDRCKELEAQNKILLESARANYHFSNANRLSAIQVQKSKYRK